MQLSIVCLREGGMIRGGIRHGRLAVHHAGDLSLEQLREMLAEPELAVIVGRPLTEDDIDAMEKDRRAAKAPAAPAAAAAGKRKGR